MKIELEVDGKVIFTEEGHDEDIKYRHFHLKALAKSKYKRREWKIFITKPAKLWQQLNVKYVDVAEADRMLKSGKSADDVASFFEVSKKTIYLKRKEAGLVTPLFKWDISAAYEMRKQGMKLREISEKLKISIATIARQLSKFKVGE